MKKYKLPVSLESFLKQKNINSSSLKLLKNDASRRQYYRVNNLRLKCLLMDSTLEKNSLKDFIKISSWLKKNGFSAPNLYSVDERKGLLLLEDFEENKFSILLKKK